MAAKKKASGGRKKVTAKAKKPLKGAKKTGKVQREPALHIPASQVLGTKKAKKKKAGKRAMKLRAEPDYCIYGTTDDAKGRKKPKK